MNAILSLDWFLILTSLAKTLGIIFLIVLPMVSYTVYAERRVSALIQDRLGPNRVNFPISLLGFKNDLKLPPRRSRPARRGRREIHPQGRPHARARK